MQLPTPLPRRAAPKGVAAAGMSDTAGQLEGLRWGSTSGAQGQVRELKPAPQDTHVLSRPKEKTDSDLTAIVSEPR